MLQPMEDVSLADRMKHKFMVQSMCVDDSISPDILDEAVNKEVVGVAILNLLL